MTRRIVWSISAALCFWAPVVLVFAIERAQIKVLVPNIAATLGLLSCFAARRRFYPTEKRLSVWMLLGLYCFGPVLLSAANTFANGGFAQIHNWSAVGWLLFASVFPPLLLLQAFWSGLLPSLLIATALLWWDGGVDEVLRRVDRRIDRRLE